MGHQKKGKYTWEKLEKTAGDLKALLDIVKYTLQNTPVVYIKVLFNIPIGVLWIYFAYWRVIYIKNYTAFYKSNIKNSRYIKLVQKCYLHKIP